MENKDKGKKEGKRFEVKKWNAVCVLSPTNYLLFASWAVWVKDQGGRFQASALTTRYVVSSAT